MFSKVSNSLTPTITDENLNGMGQRPPEQRQQLERLR